MKILNKIFTATLALMAISCNEGIDPISFADPGPDTAAPVVTVSSPSSDKVTIPPTDNAASVDFKFEVTDDIEIKSISVSLDGTSLASYSSFKDYRRSVNSHLYENLPIGNHTLQINATDMSNKTTTTNFSFELSNVYQPKYPGEVFYLPFEAGLYMDFVSKSLATPIGTPGFSNGKFGKAYAGDVDEYITFPTTGLLGDEFSATFWYKTNASPDRSGILVIGPVDLVNPSAPNNRTKGFRFFREGGAANQTFKLNVGNGTADSWFDGGANATLNPATADWVHMAFTISDTKCVVYFNGQVVSEGNFSGVDWTSCDIISIASGAPRFTEWGHLSDKSLIDELRLYNKALTQDEVNAVMTEN